MRSRARTFLALAWACLAGAIGPVGLMSLMGLGAPSSEDLIPFTSFSVGSAALGVAACGLAFHANRSALPVVLGLLLSMPGALSTVILMEGLRQYAHTADATLCGRAERDGRVIRRGEAGYHPRLDEDADGLACEPILGPQCYQGRCVPFG